MNINKVISVPILLYTGFSVAGQVYLDNSAPIVTYTGNWADVSQPSTFMGSVNKTVSTGDFFEFNFDGGDKVTLLSTLAPDGGSSQVYVDGVHVGDIDLKSATVENLSEVFSLSNYETGVHTAKVVLASGKELNIDAIKIVSSESFVNDSHSNNMYSDSWNHSKNRGGSLVDNDLHYTTKVGASLSIPFVGTGVELKSEVAPSHGLMEVYVDGNPHGLIDLSQSIREQVTVFYINNLQYAAHELKLVFKSGGYGVHDAYLPLTGGITHSTEDSTKDGVLNKYDPDFDNDFVPDFIDVDDDGDGVNDGVDAFPFNKAESSDFDGDGVGDNSDSDIDGDGTPNNLDSDPLNPLLPAIGIRDSDLRFDRDNGLLESQNFVSTVNGTAVVDGGTFVGVNGISYASHVFSPSEVALFADQDYNLVFNARLLSGMNNYSSVSIGGLRYLVWYKLDGNGALVAEFESGETFTLDSGSGANSFHTFNVQYLSETNTAELFFDGHSIGVFGGVASSQDGGVYFGNGSSSRNGSIEFDELRFDKVSNGVFDNLLDFDNDSINDPIDEDDDGDNVDDIDDAFPLDSTETIDTDGDGVGNNADLDDDGDNVDDVDDAFPLDSTESIDTDGDGVGNNADLDDDGDGILDEVDFQPLTPNPLENGIKTSSLRFDVDSGSVLEQGFVVDVNSLGQVSGGLFEGVGGLAQAKKTFTNLESQFFQDSDYNLVFNGKVISGNVNTSYAVISGRRYMVYYQINSVGELVAVVEGDASYIVANSSDASKMHTFNIQYSSDDLEATFIFNGEVVTSWTGVSSNKSEGLYFGNSSSGTNGVIEFNELRFDKVVDGVFENRLDFDNDGVVDPVDTDDDNDGVDDVYDSFPKNGLEFIDTDGDGVGNNSDLDDDNDGVVDTDDSFPLDSTESIDTDGDGIGNNSDLDDDGDGTPDVDDTHPLDPTKNNDESGFYEALAIGDVSRITTPLSSFEDFVIDRAQSYVDRDDLILGEIYQDAPIELPVIKTSTHLVVDDVVQYTPLLIGVKGNLFGLINYNGGVKNAGFSTSMISQVAGGGSDYEPHLLSLLNWMLDNNFTSVDNPPVIRFAFTPTTIYDNASKWLLSVSPNVDLAMCDPIVDLSSCLDADLIITTGNTVASISEIDNAMAGLSSINKLYFHSGNWSISNENVNEVSKHLGFKSKPYGDTGNWFPEDYASWSNYKEMLDTSFQAQVANVVTSFRDDNLPFSFALCSQGYWHTECKNLSGFNEIFYGIIQGKVASVIADFDNSAVDIFGQGDYELQKLLILLGDKYREGIAYPMDRINTPNIEFGRAMFADGVVSNVRKYNAGQSDLGNFSRADFSHITPTTREVTLSAKRPFKSTGAYALPGQTFKVTRLDSSTQTAQIFINAVRVESTLAFDRNGYKRPNVVRSNYITVASGESVEITNPYGGPIQVAFSDDGFDAEFLFENVGEHPYWAGEADTALFLQQLEQNDYDWAEFTTEYFELHSRLSKMVKSLEAAPFDTPEKLAEGINRYEHNLINGLAGFEGDGIEVDPEVVSFKDKTGLPLNQYTTVKHGVADQASCGGGCSGNPYDFNWVFSPTSHGDMHEIGHSIQDNRFTFAGAINHAATNFYAFNGKAKFFEKTGLVSTCKPLGFEILASRLATSLNQEDPFESMSNYGLVGWSEGTTAVIQYLSIAQDQAGLDDGWQALPMLHMVSNRFSFAKSSEANWESVKGSIGLDMLTYAEGKKMNDNDFMVIALGKVLELDFSDYFHMFGKTINPIVIAQISSEGYPLVERQLYMPKFDGGYCQDLIGTRVDVVDSNANGVLDGLE